MDTNVNALCSQGQTTLGTRIPASSLGQMVPFPHKLTANGDLLSGRSGGARIVINDSGGTLLPGRGIRWKDGYYGLKIGALSGAGEPADGVIDHTIPSAGVANGDACLVVTQPGTPVYVVTDGANALARGDYLKTAADGEFTKDTGTPSTNGKAGSCEDTTIAATDQLRFWMEFSPH